MTYGDSDDPGTAADSYLISGPAPARFEHAATRLADADDAVSKMCKDGGAALALSGGETAIVTESDGSNLSEFGIAVSKRVDELGGPDVLIAVDAVTGSRDVDPLALFRFLHLLRCRVVSAGGKFVCTLGDEVDPLTEDVVAELFANRERLRNDGTERPVGELPS